MPPINVTQNRLIHHLGNGLLYSVMSPSHTWLVSSGFGSPGRRFAVHHNNHAAPPMLRTISAITYHDQPVVIMRPLRHPAAGALRRRRSCGGADSTPRPSRRRTPPAGSRPRCRTPCQPPPRGPCLPRACRYETTASSSVLPTTSLSAFSISASV